MKILYVKKQERGAFWKRSLRELRDSFNWHNRVAFFCASLQTQADVKRVSLNQIKKYSKEEINKFDAVIFNYECNFRERGHPFETSEKAIRKILPNLTNVPLLLLIASPNAHVIPNNKMMDLFDLVFKREHYKDLARYDLTPKNRGKLRTTALSCPLIPANIFNYNSINPKDYGFKNVPGNYTHDIFFVGQETSKTLMRTNIIKAVSKSDVNFYGGLHQDVRNKEREIPEHLKFPRLSQKKFYRATRSSKINLALEGYGQFTYRHWECWALSAFMISSPSVNEIKLPFEFIDGEHFVTFQDKNDLLDKISYYLQNETKREMIAENGRRLFEQEYDFHKHGTYIVNAIEKIL